MIVTGDKVLFDPFKHDRVTDVGNLRKNVIGEVVEVNYAHKWFSVEYGEPKLRTSFKFCEIGKSVSICG